MIVTNITILPTKSLDAGLSFMFNIHLLQFFDFNANQCYASLGVKLVCVPTAITCFAQPQVSLGFSFKGSAAKAGFSLSDGQVFKEIS